MENGEEAQGLGDIPGLFLVALNEERLQPRLNLGVGIRMIPRIFILKGSQMGGNMEDFSRRC